MATIFRLKPNQLKSDEPRKLTDGGGLSFIVEKSGRKSWAFFYTSPTTGKRREMGLGNYPTVTLKAAREEAAKWREVKALGNDPIKERNREREEARVNGATLKNVLLAAFEARKAGLKEEGRSGRWWSALNNHVLPKIGDRPISELTAEDIKRTLKPIWFEKQEVARKALQRLRIGFKHAIDMGINVSLDIIDSAQRLLGKQPDKHNPFPAMEWKSVHEYYSVLEETGTIPALALQMAILTSRRSGEVRRMKLADIKDDVWYVPPEDLKGKKGQHTEPQRVPLSKEALRIIEKAKPFARDGYLFPRQTKHPRARDKFMNENGMSKLMKDQGMNCVPHGFRASFRTWAAEAGIMYDAAEIQQGHEVRGRVERSYNRSDLLEERKLVVERWAQVVLGTAGAKVIKPHNSMA
ncbi:Integrase [Pseudovibrio denitrificans]|uniref:Integrase n=2 Tax=Pseudovibrio denitrificans TaxID=258256 RepID=A0A1I7DNZ5_9HYPH|nr:Integrase [Pseudovibrio denitrificans]